MNFMEKVALKEKRNEAFALATIVESKGSTPRHVGKMIVEPDGSIDGTIGGGIVELYVIETAIEAIKTGKSTLESYLLDEKSGGISMHCGGKVTVFIEVYCPKPILTFIGAGHLAYALSQLADMLEYPYIVIDDRPTYCTPERFPGADGLYVNEVIETAIRQAQLTERHYTAIFTKDSDDRSLKTVLEASCPYIGMIGSKAKIKRVFEKLENEGVDADKLKGVHTPIGLSIGAETPEEIAISIMAEIMQIYKKKS